MSALSTALKRFLMVSLVALPGLLPITSAEGLASTLYVNRDSSSCLDTGSGTQSQPYCTIGKGAAAAVAGQTVQVVSGTYAENVSPAHSGSAGLPIVFTAAPGAIVTITGTAAGSNGVTINGRSYITIQNFTFSGTVGHGISAPAVSSNLVLRGNHITGAGLSIDSSTIKRGISLSAASNSLVTGNTIDHNTGPGVYLAASSSGNTVDGNTISYNASGITNSSGIYQRWAPGIDIRGNSNTVSDNVTHHNDDSGIQVWSGATGNLVINNSAYTNFGYPNIQAGDHGIDISNAPNNSVVGNTVYNNRTAGINVEGTSTGTTVANNLAVDNGLSDGRTNGNIRVTTTSVSGTSLDFDIVFNTSGTAAVIVWNSTGYASVASLRTASGQEANGLQANPGWVSPSAGDFHLTPGSLAIDSADSAAPGEKSTDLESSARRDELSINNTGIGPVLFNDRGAYEF